MVLTKIVMFDTQRHLLRLITLSINHKNEQSIISFRKE